VRRRLLALSGAAAIAAAPAGCSSSVGPLGSPGDDPGQECVSLNPGQVLSYGLTEFRFSGNDPVMITRTGLVDPDGAKWVAAWIVPGSVHYGYGVARGYPPSRPLPPEVDWAARQRARGAVLKPTHGTEEYNLVVVIRLTAGKGTVKAIGVWYSAGGSSYYFQPPISIAMQPSCYS
jgi:hypothetical protein